MANELTELEQNVLSAVENEADSFSAAEKQQGLHLDNTSWLRAYRNAYIYADMFGVSVEAFRDCLNKLSHNQFTDKD